MSDDQKVMKADDYANAVTALGTGGDKSSYAFFCRRPDLSVEQLDALYEQDAIAARIIDRIVDDATREGFKIEGADEAFDFGSLESELEDLGVLNSVGDAWRWARLYGGAVIVMVANDGMPMDQPMRLNAVQKLSALQVVEAPFIIPSGWNPGLGARAFRDPEFYEIVVPFGSGPMRKVHRSRVIRFDGMKTSPTRSIARNGWAPSVLDRVWREIAQLGEVMGYSRNILHRISVLQMKIEDLRAQLCGSQQDQQDVRRIFESIKWSFDNLNMLVVDSKDELGEVASTVSGLDVLINRFVEAVVRATDMPRTVLLGEQPGGLNANADSEIRAWYDFVSAQQDQVLTPACARIVEVLFAARANRKEPVPQEWTIEWSPLWQPTEKEQADTRLVQAQTDQIYLLNGIESAGEIRQRLIASGDIEPIEMGGPDVGT